VPSIPGSFLHTPSLCDDWVPFLHRTWQTLHQINRVEGQRNSDCEQGRRSASTMDRVPTPARRMSLLGSKRTPSHASTTDDLKRAVIFPQEPNALFPSHMFSHYFHLCCTSTRSLISIQQTVLIERTPLIPLLFLCSKASPLSHVYSFCTQPFVRDRHYFPKYTGFFFFYYTCIKKLASKEGEVTMAGSEKYNSRVRVVRVE